MTLGTLSEIETEAWTAVQDLMGEAVTYHGSGSLDRSVTAVVRLPNDHPPDDVDRFRTAVLEMSVDNNATTGISAAEFDRRDTVTLSPRSGQTAVKKRINRIIRQNASFIVYEVT